MAISLREFVIIFLPFPTVFFRQAVGPSVEGDLSAMAEARLRIFATPGRSSKKGEN